MMSNGNEALFYQRTIDSRESRTVVLKDKHGRKHYRRDARPYHSIVRLYSQGERWTA